MSALGDSLVLTSSSSTLYNYPNDVCSTSNAACLAAGQIVTTDMSLLGEGALSTSAETFVGASDLLTGQELILSVGSDLVAGTAPSFTTSSVYLEPSQPIGTVGTIDASTASLELDGLSGLLTGSRPGIQQVHVQTGSGTTFVGFSSASLTATAAGQSSRPKDRFSTPQAVLGCQHWVQSKFAQKRLEIEATSTRSVGDSCIVLIVADRVEPSRPPAAAPHLRAEFASLSAELVQGQIGSTCRSRGWPPNPREFRVHERMRTDLPSRTLPPATRR